MTSASRPRKPWPRSSHCSGSSNPDRRAVAGNKRVWIAKPVGVPRHRSVRRTRVEPVWPACLRGRPIKKARCFATPGLQGLTQKDSVALSQRGDGDGPGRAIGPGRRRRLLTPGVRGTACHHALCFVRLRPTSRWCCSASLSRKTSRRINRARGSPIRPDYFRHRR